MYEDRAGNPILAMKIRFACASVGAVALVYFAVLAIYLAPGLLLLGSSYPITASIETRHHRFFGAQYEIRVGHSEYWCSGGDAGNGPPRGAPIVYDAQHPERCRAKSSIGRLGTYELIAALGSAAFIAAGLGATLLWKNNRARTVAFGIAVLLGWSYVAVGFFVHGR
jgi:hypothetical protein